VLITKTFTLVELNTNQGAPVEPSIYPQLLSSDSLNDIDGTISEARHNAGQYSAILNGSIAGAAHTLLINQNLQIDALAAPSTDIYTIKLRLNGSISVAWTEDRALIISGPAMRQRTFNEIMARAIIAFFLANKHLYPGVVAEMPAMVKAYTDDSDDKEQCLCRFADAVSYYLEQIVSEADSNISRLCISTEFPALSGYTLLYNAKLLEDSFRNPEAAVRFQSVVLGANDADSQVTESTGSYVGPLKEKLLRYISGAKHTLISGPTATGKTLAVEEACQNSGAPLTILKGAEYLEDLDMIGGINPVGEKMSIVYGPLTRALKAGQDQYNLQLIETEKANGVWDPVRIPPAVLFIDEINRLQPKYLNMLITAMNVSKDTNEHSIEIPCNAEIVTCPAGYFMLIGAQNIGQLHLTYDMDLALLRRFHSKISVDYLPYDQELELIKKRNPSLSPDVVTVLCKCAQDTRYQLSGLKAPIDTDSLLKWASEISELIEAGQMLSIDLLTSTATDIIFAICLERSLSAAYDLSGVAILTDNLTENYRNSLQGGTP
jgi:MoxR-like ATPase